jgi:hypothetical protein
MSQRGSIPYPAVAHVHRRLWLSRPPSVPHVILVPIGLLNLRPAARTLEQHTDALSYPILPFSPAQGPVSGWPPW